jgi:hypothetical protein
MPVSQIRTPQLRRDSKERYGVMLGGHGPYMDHMSSPSAERALQRLRIPLFTQHKKQQHAIQQKAKRAEQVN